jgi:hypothetical protein
VALNGRGDTHQICRLLKVNRPCHLAAVTSQFDPDRAFATEAKTTGIGSREFDRGSRRVAYR